jgi:hypothetical protein
MLATTVVGAVDNVMVGKLANGVSGRFSGKQLCFHNDVRELGFQPHHATVWRNDLEEKH